jgi:hypothetical protein
MHRCFAIYIGKVASDTSVRIRYFQIVVVRPSVPIDNCTLILPRSYILSNSTSFRKTLLAPLRRFHKISLEVS